MVFRLLTGESLGGRPIRVVALRIDFLSALQPHAKLIYSTSKGMKLHLPKTLFKSQLLLGLGIAAGSPFNSIRVLEVLAETPVAA